MSRDVKRLLERDKALSKDYTDKVMSRVNSHVRERDIHEQVLEYFREMQGRRK